MIPPTIALRNCILRPFQSTDAAALFSVLQDKEVIQFMPWKESPSMERVEQLIDEQTRQWRTRQYGWWALQSLASQRLMGWCGLQHLPETGETEVGFLLGKNYWGNGIATAAASASLRYGFTSVGLEKVIGLVHARNARSIQVLKKLGMKMCDQVHLWGMDLDRYCITSRKYFELADRRN